MKKKEASSFVSKRQIAKEGEPTDDGLVMIHRDGNRIAAIEFLDLAEL